MSKTKLIRQGTLPTYITVTDKEINPTKYYNSKNDNEKDIDVYELNIESSDSEDSEDSNDDDYDSDSLC